MKNSIITIKIKDLTDTYYFSSEEWNEAEEVYGNMIYEHSEDEDVHVSWNAEDDSVVYGNWISSVGKYTVEELSKKFTEILKSWNIPFDVINEINKNNSDACASHEFCDPNEAMLEALESFKVEWSILDDYQSNMIDKAWNLAKQNDFYINN